MHWTTLFVTETSFQFKEWYSEPLQQRLCTQNKTKRIEKIIFPYSNKIYIPSCLNLKGWAWRWFLRKQRVLQLLQERLLSKNMKKLKIVLFFPHFPSPFPRLSHSIVLREFPLTIIIVDRIKINYSKQLFPFSESELSTLSANCTFRHILRLFRLFRGDRSGMDKSSSATCLFYSNVVKGSKWPRK